MAMSRPRLQNDGSGRMFECPICLLPMNDHKPRALHCLHTFCEPCLIEWVKKNQNGKIICPTCQQITLLPQGGVSALPINFQLEQFSVILHQDKYCQNCMETVQSPPLATSFCDTCQRKFCGSCTAKHRNIQVFSQHVLVPLKIEKSPTCDKTTKSCAQHDMALDIYCSVCEECVCMLCAMNERHSEHYDKLHDLKKEIDNACQQASQTLNPMKTNLSSVYRSINDRLNSLNQLKANIREEGNERKRHIDLDVEKLQNKLEESYICPVKECIKCLQLLEEDIRKTENIIGQKQTTQTTLTQLKRHTCECIEQNQRLVDGVKKLSDFPEILVSPEQTTFAALSSRGIHFDIPEEEDPGNDPVEKRGARVTRLPGHGHVVVGTVLGVCGNGSVAVQWDNGVNNFCQPDDLLLA